MTRTVQERRIKWTKDNAHLLAGYRDEPSVDVGSMVRAMRRQTPLVMIFATAGVVIAILMILGSVPLYTAAEKVLLDEERAELLDEVSPLPNAVRSDTAVQSEIEIIKSHTLAYKVVDLLNLEEDANFLWPPIGFMQKLKGVVLLLTDPLARLLTRAPAVGSSTNATAGGESGEDGAPLSNLNLEVTDRDLAAQILRERLTVSRSGRSLVIEIGFSDHSPLRAAQIARGYGIAYEGFQLVTSNEVAAKAEDWLRERLDVLEQKSIDAASALQEFREANDLVQVRGNLLTEQQQSELATELMKAAADAAEAEAKLGSLEALLLRAKNGEEIITVPFVAGQLGGIIDQSRRDYLNASQSYRRMVSQFGDDHPQAQQLNRKVDALKKAIIGELEQTTEVSRVAYNTSLSREQSLHNDLEAITDTSAENVALRGKLQQLQAISETYAIVYRDYLTRLELAMQQQNFPIASVKIISPAEIPKSPSSPKKKAMLFAGVLLGGILGVLIGAGRELLPKTVRTASTLRQEIGVHCAGMLPSAKSLEDKGAERARLRTLERLTQVCEANSQQASGVLVGVAPLSPGLEDEHSLPVELAVRLASNGARRVLIVHEEKTQGVLPAATVKGVETVSLQTVLQHWPGVDGMGALGFDFKRLANHLRDEFSFVLFAMRPIIQADRTDPHSWAYDTTILRISWGQVLPSFIADALKDHPEFQASLVTMVLEDADLAIARQYMTPGSYEELEINA